MNYSIDNETFEKTGQAPSDYRPEYRRFPRASREFAAQNPWLGYSDAAISEVFIGKSF